MKNKLKFHTDSLLHSYAQVFFSQNKLLACLIIVCTFLKPNIGFIALTSVLAANTLVYFWGYELKLIREGMYGFNVLLLEVALSNMFIINAAFLVLIIVSIVIVTIFTIVANSIFGKHYLPAVSIPFFLSFWLIKLAAPSFVGLETNLDEVYWINSTYKIGGNKLLELYIYFENIPIPLFFSTYFKALGSVFFMPYNLTGILITIGLFAFSRIALSLSLIAYLVAWKGATLFGYNQTNFIFEFTGSNIIFSAIGIGCFYLVPSFASYLLAIILVPITLLMCSAFNALLLPWNLPAMTMPFAFVTVGTLHALRLRWFPYFVRFVDVQYYSPEKVVYKANNISERFSKVFPIKMQLPILGKWFVSQGYDGKITHKNNYSKAIDFVITDDVDNKTYSGNGVNLEDYYCYGKPVFAAAAGYVSYIENNVDDNKIKDVNLEQNWGNTLIIYHAEGVYSKLSHLKKDSVKHYVGDYIKAGELIATCGSSGRSPEPHLHYQIQYEAKIDAHTMKYPFAYFIEYENKKAVFKQFEVPKENDVVENIQLNKLLSESLYFIPGKKLKFRANDVIIDWEIYTDSYNRTYIYCHTTQSTAYFVNDGTVFYFTDFEGNKKSLLFYFYLGCYKILMAFYSDLIIEDTIPSDTFNNKLVQPIQDFVAPFYEFIKADYKLNYEFIDDEFSASRIELKSIINTHSKTIVWRKIICEIVFENGKISTLNFTENGKNIMKAQCIE